jgi:hypothetical protein
MTTGRQSSGRGRGRSHGLETTHGNRTARGRNNQNQDLPSPWRTSSAKTKLLQLLKDPNSYVHFADPMDVHTMDDDFKKYNFDRFKVNFKNLKALVDSEREASSFDETAYKRELVTFPRNPTTDRGYLRWDGHKAQKQLESDVKTNCLDGKDPKEIHAMADRDYSAFPLSIFRKHLYQEQRKQREAVAWQHRRNKKGYSLHQAAKKQETSPVELTAP